MTATKNPSPARLKREQSPVASDPNRSPERDVGVLLAEAISKARYEGLPAAAVTAAKRSLIDTIAVVVGATGIADEVGILAEVASESGGRPEATMLGFGKRVPATMAALVNGAMVHCLDYDDCYQDLALHPSAPTVPAALAMAERVGGVSGKTLITAIAVANDFAWRLGTSFDWKLDWFSTPLLGYFTATAAAGVILGLDGDRMFQALGIAFGQAGGTLEMRLTSSTATNAGSPIGGMMSGWPAKAGVLSALLAQRGMHGIPGVFEGKFGFYNMFNGGKYRRESLVDGLGVEFHGDEASFRPWPTCGGSHPTIDATLHLVHENEIPPDDIDAIEVRIGHAVDWMLCEPLDKRQRPATSMDARFSIPFDVATAVIRKSVTLNDFVEHLTDPRVLALAAKVTPVWDPSMQEFTAGIAGSHQVTIRMRNGATYSHRSDLPYGRHPSDITQADLDAKFRDCVAFSSKPVDAPNVERALDILKDLEHCLNVSELTAALYPD